LPAGVDGKTHKLGDYASADPRGGIQCNHCPGRSSTGRIELYATTEQGRVVCRINPNNPKSIRLNELGYTDVTDSLDEMKIRTAFRRIEWPYLYDGETQGVSIKFGVVATPHIYLFDEARKLQYQGRIDDNQREELVKSQDARNALEAMLAGKLVPVTTPTRSAARRWMSRPPESRVAKIQAAGHGRHGRPDDLKKLRENSGGRCCRQLLVNRLCGL
jgi:hypothetical protein